MLSSCKFFFQKDAKESELKEGTPTFVRLLRNNISPTWRRWRLELCPQKAGSRNVLLQKIMRFSCSRREETKGNEQTKFWMSQREHIRMARRNYHRSGKWYRLFGPWGYPKRNPWTEFSVPDAGRNGIKNILMPFILKPLGNEGTTGDVGLVNRPQYHGKKSWGDVRIWCSKNFHP